MASFIEVWQIEKDQTLTAIDTTLAENGRTEPADMETWLSNKPEIISPDIRLIGRQVATTSGPLDLLAIDSSGNTVVIELKRDKVAREALIQAIDYASDISSWEIEKLSSECEKHNEQSLKDFFEEQYPDKSIDDINFNADQRILLVGFRIDENLQRMAEWLHNKYAVEINILTLKYIKTAGGEELLAKTSIFDEKTEIVKSGRKFSIPKSDAPGDYENDGLKQKLLEYFNANGKIPQAIKTVLFKLCLENKTVTRVMLKDECTKQGLNPNLVVHISTQMGLERNDFLRQVISYSYPDFPWEKNNYQLTDSKYTELVEQITNGPVNVD
jgi:hypothetical protein